MDGAVVTSTRLCWVTSTRIDEVKASHKRWRTWDDDGDGCGGGLVEVVVVVVMGDIHTH